MKGLSCEVMGRCCGNGSYTDVNDSIIVVNVDGPFDAKCPEEEYMLVDDRPCGRPYPKLVPVNRNRQPGEVGPMFSGRYAIGDSRLQKAVEKMGGGPYGVVPIFDRFEEPWN